MHLFFSLLFNSRSSTICTYIYTQQRRRQRRTTTGFSPLLYSPFHTSKEEEKKVEKAKKNEEKKKKEYEDCCSSMFFSFSIGQMYCKFLFSDRHSAYNKVPLVLRTRNRPVNRCIQKDILFFFYSEHL